MRTQPSSAIPKKKLSTFHPSSSKTENPNAKTVFEMSSESRFMVGWCCGGRGPFIYCIHLFIYLLCLVHCDDNNHIIMIAWVLPPSLFTRQPPSPPPRSIAAVNTNPTRLVLPQSPQNRTLTVSLPFRLPSASALIFTPSVFTVSVVYSTALEYLSLSLSLFFFSFLFFFFFPSFFLYIQLFS